MSPTIQAQIKSINDDDTGVLDYKDIKAQLNYKDGVEEVKGMSLNASLWS